MKRNLGEKGRKQGGGSKYKEGVAEEQDREAAFQKRGIKITSRHKWCYFWLHNLKMHFMIFKIYLEIGERFASETKRKQSRAEEVL